MDFLSSVKWQAGAKDMLKQGLAFFFPIKGQIVNILGIVGIMISVETTQLCHCSRKAAIDNTDNE